jgi:hypothetical protein
MSKTIILGTLTASAAFAPLPLTAATARPPASVKTAPLGPAPWSLVPVPSIAGPAERTGHERNDRHDRPGRAAAGNGGQTAPPALPRQMRQAIVQAGYGSADVLL